jgi:hypothetical protein
MPPLHLRRLLAPALPWLADLNKKLQSYTEQNFAAAYQFTRELSQAKDMQDFVQISVAKLPPPQKWSKAQKRAPPSPRGVSVI